MKTETLHELRSKNLLTEDQHTRLEAIYSKKVLSIFYELRTLLYLGVLLFTAGVGILIYMNIGDIGHMASIVGLSSLTAACLFYSFQKAVDYSRARVKAPSPYYDYVVLLGCLLFISVLGYLQFQYAIFDERLGSTTLITAAFFFYAAYRFDHLGVLSLAITALASFWSISLSPQKWYSGDFFETADLHITAMIFSAILAAIAIVLDKKDVKRHFSFTYINFCSLLFLIGAFTGMIIEDEFYFLYLLLLYAGAASTFYFALWKKSFLFLVYAVLVAYAGTTNLLIETVISDEVAMLFYLAASCGGLIYFIIRYKNYFKRHE